jgi:hypothetical protein
MTSKETSAVRELLRQVYAAWADNDADTFAALFLDDDATVVMPDVFHRSRPAQPRASRPSPFALTEGYPVRISRGGRVHRPGPDRRVAPARSPSSRPGRNPRSRVRAGPDAARPIHQTTH